MALYVGTYTRGGSRGIYRLTMNAQTGALRVQNSYPGIENPSFLAIDPSGQYLFAVSETDRYENAPGGSVASFAIDAKTGDLTKRSQQPSGGAAPAHVSVNRSASFVVVANYNGGSVSLLPVRNGVLDPPASVHAHTGSSVHPQRQQRPHAHSIVLDPDEEHAISADLGTDDLWVYRLDEEAPALVPADPSTQPLPPGSGPRHLVFHPDGKHLFVINELASTITAFSYAAGGFESIATISTLPEDFNGANTCAEIRVAASGRFVYGSNRGHDSIAVFGVESSGALSPIQHVPSGGRTPRSFEIDPSGQFLLVANQDSNNVVVYRVDEESGLLTATDHEVVVPVPVCVRFRPQ